MLVEPERAALNVVLGATQVSIVICSSYRTTDAKLSRQCDAGTDRVWALVCTERAMPAVISHHIANGCWQRSCNMATRQAWERGNAAYRSGTYTPLPNISTAHVRVPPTAAARRRHRHPQPCAPRPALQLSMTVCTQLCNISSKNFH